MPLLRGGRIGPIRHATNIEMFTRASNLQVRSQYMD